MEQNNYEDVSLSNSSPQYSENTSGQGAKAVVPEEIKKWSWGASLLTWIWGICHKVWISLLVFIPYVGWVIPIVLGIKGNEWAWRAQHYNSIAEFQEREKKWAIAGFIVLGIIVLLIILFYSIIFSLLEGLLFGLNHIH